MKNNPVGWFEIYVPDLSLARAFYERVLDTTLSPLPTPIPGLEMAAFPMDHTQPGATGALVKMTGKDSGIGGTIIYFKCEDCAVEAARVTPAGGHVVREKFSIGDYGHIALVTDPDGNMFGLHSME